MADLENAQSMAKSFVNRAGVDGPNPLDDAPDDIKEAVLEARSLNANGLCGVMGCGRSLTGCCGCGEHEPHATPSQRLEARMQRLIGPRSRRRYY